MSIRTTLIASSLIVAALASGSAHAALQGRDLNGSIDSFEAYYDTDLDITWLANANQSAGSSYDDGGINTDGRMTWASANAWAANLSFTDGVNVYDNWRLPTTLQPDLNCDNQTGSGYGCTGSEMGYLFYIELGGTAGQSILASGDPDLAKFTNLQPGVFWSATEFELNSEFAWNFSMDGGFQDVNYKFIDYYAWAVSSGDVGAVPEAQNYALMLAGLGLIGWRARLRG